MKKSFLLGIILLLGSSTAWSATVYAPTNQNVNFINTDTLCYVNGTGCPDAILGIFDELDTGYSGSFLGISLGKGGDVAEFTQTIGQSIDYGLSNNSGETNSTFTLTGSDRFIIALKAPISGGSWVAPSEEICSDTSESCFLSWSIGGSVFAIDIEEVTPPSEVPVPAALWLFGSGLLGLVGMARRKKA